MFVSFHRRSRKLRSVQRKSHRTMTRKLSVEPLEERWMLSASATLLQPLLLHSARPVVTSARDDSAAHPSMPLTFVHEGGFLSQPVGTTYDTIPAPAFTNPATTAFSGGFSTSAIGPITTIDSRLDPRPVDLSPNLKPAVIVPAAPLDAPDTNLFPQITPIQPAYSTGDGGSIAISALLTGFRNEQSSLAAANPATMLSGNSSADGRGIDRSLATAGRALPGEWARAIVFDIAGGEPEAKSIRSIGSKLDQASIDDPTSRLNDSLSVEQASPTWLKPARSDADYHRAAVNNTIGNGRPVVDPNAGPRNATPTATDSACLDGHFSERNIALVAYSPGDSARAADESHHSADAQTALSSAIDPMRATSPAMVESSRKSRSWTRVSFLAPLFTMLAIEQFAAVRPRRVPGHETLVSTSKAV